jgi:catechol 2,3-dioxygenase-like lactoylglutathione lyase family enzyme
MLDHTGFAVSDFERSRAFYEAALAPLSISLIVEFSAEQTGSDAYAGFGSEGRPYFWIGDGGGAFDGLHIAFAARTRAEVDAFHHAALQAGGRDNGAPGLRPHYHENYYGAFVLDPDGVNIEAVCHKAE